MIEFSMLLVNNNRSKAYLQNLVRNGIFPKKIIFLDDGAAKFVEQTEYDKFFQKGSKQTLLTRLDDIGMEFNEKEHVLDTVEKFNIDCVDIGCIDVNSDIVIAELLKISEEFVLYSGPGGMILREKILSIGKKFIHAHSGWLPRFRGSTTIYYEMLAGRKIGCSVIILNNELDGGDILYRAEYDISEKSVDIDYALDPLIRARTLLDFFHNGRQEKIKQNANDGLTFYIIHPLLKHCAILKYKSRGRCEKNI